MTAPVRIDRCVCFNRTLAELRAIADATGARTLADLERHVAFGQRCGLCRPYVDHMLRTGEVTFGTVLPPVDA